MNKTIYFVGRLTVNHPGTYEEAESDLLAHVRTAIREGIPYDLEDFSFDVELKPENE